MNSSLSHDEVLDALDRDIQQYPPDSPDYQELLRLRAMLIRARVTGDTVHIVSVSPKTRKH